MSSLKPVIHGRDHLPGGADPIPALANLYSPQSAEAHYEAAPTGCAAIDTTEIAMSFYDGASSIAAPTSPNKLVVAEAGVYACSVGVTVFPPAVEPASAAVDLSVKAIQLGGPGWSAIPGSLPGVGTFLNGVLGTDGNSDTWTPTVCVVALFSVSDYFSISVFNRNSFTVDLVVRAALTRIVQL